MDDTVKESEVLIAAAFDAIDEGIVIVDDDNTVRHINRAAQNLLQVSSDDACGRRWIDIIRVAAGPADDYVKLKNGVLCPGEYTISLASLTASGSAPQRSVELRITALSTTGCGALITLREGESIASLQKALDESRRQLEVTLNRGQIGLFEWDTRTHILTEFGYWVGKTPHTADSNSAHDSIMLADTHPDDVARVQAALTAHIKGEAEYYEVEQRIRRIDGGYYHFLVRGQAAETDASGRVLRVIGTIVDISALREQEAVLKLALESGRQGVWEWDLETNRVTEHGYRWAGQEQENVSAQLDGAIALAQWEPGAAAVLREQTIQHLRGEIDSIELEAPVRRKDGTWGVFLVRGRALDRDANGRFKRILGTYTDISAIKSQESRLQIALENGRQGLFELEPDADHITFSREWYAMFGHPEGSLTSLSKDMRGLVHPADWDIARTALLELLRGETTTLDAEYRLRRADGSYIHILARARIAERNAAGRAINVIGTHVDITKLKNAEGRLIESRRLLETVIDAFPQRVFWKDRDNRYLGCNRMFALDAGVATPSDLVGMRVEDIEWPSPMHPIIADDRRVLDGGESKIVVRRPFKPVSGPEYIAETTKVPIRDPDGAVMGILGIFDDISERVAREHQLQTVADAFTRTAKSRLLDALTEAAAALAGADYAFVARIDDHDGDIARVTASFPYGTVRQNASYVISTTPCGHVLRDDYCYIPTGVAGAYPKDQALSEWGIEGYAGQRLVDADGGSIGIFTLLFVNSAPAEAGLRTVLDIFAARAAAELEREQAVEVLTASQQRLNAAIAGGAQGVWEWTIETDAWSFFGQLHSDLEGHNKEHAIRTGAEFYARFHPEDRATLTRALLNYYRGQHPSYEVEARIRDPQGEYRWTLIRGQAASRD
ncbi:MAG: PAS domain S-box protein, partial [Proteobacteria bacterium]